MIYTLLSNRGGVGKTTIAANLSLALSRLKEKILVVEGDFGAASLYLIFDIKPKINNFKDVLEGRAYIEDAIIEDFYPNLSILPNKIPIKTFFEMDAFKFIDVIKSLANNFSIIIVDGPAGIGKPSLISMKLADEIIIVTNPNPPAVTSALKLKKIADALNVRTRGVIVNKVPPNVGRGILRQIEIYFDTPILGVIPDDHKAEECYRRKRPIIIEYPNNTISKEINRIAYDVAGRDYE